MRYRDLNGKMRDTIAYMYIRGAIFARSSWTQETYFTWNDEHEKFVYCDKYGIPKKSKYGTMSMVGEGVLIAANIIEIKKEEKMINMKNATVTVTECDEKVELTPTDLEIRGKWVGVWYTDEDDYIKTTRYSSKKKIVAELKKHPSRKVVLYKEVKMLEIDYPIKETEL